MDRVRMIAIIGVQSRFKSLRSPLVFRGQILRDTRWMNPPGSAVVSLDGGYGAEEVGSVG